MINNKEVYTLITGGSKGIGRAIAANLAARGHHLLLVARSEQELRETALELSVHHGINVDFLCADLSSASGAEEVYAWVLKKQYHINALINNAGFGIWGNFADKSLDAQLEMLQVNITTLIKLTHLFIPMLRNNDKAYILNISSTAAYQALPSMALYAASKSFVLSFSRAIRYELKDGPISVTCVCPGPVATNFAHRAGLDALDKLAKLFNMTPADVAKSSLNAMYAGKVEVTPGFVNKLGQFGSRVLPKVILERIAANLYKI